jgi:hypothetical protein
MNPHISKLFGFVTEISVNCRMRTREGPTDPNCGHRYPQKIAQAAEISFGLEPSLAPKRYKRAQILLAMTRQPAQARRFK